MKIRQEQERQRDEAMAAGEDIPLHDLPLPSIPYASFIFIFQPHLGTYITYTHLSINADKS